MNVRLAIGEKFSIENDHFVSNFDPVSPKFHTNGIQVARVEIDKPKNVFTEILVFWRNR